MSSKERFRGEWEGETPIVTLLDRHRPVHVMIAKVANRMRDIEEWDEKLWIRIEEMRSLATGLKTPEAIEVFKKYMEVR